MINLYGLWYRVIAVGGSFLLIGLTLLGISFGAKELSKKTTFLVAVLALLYGVGCFGFYGYHIANPKQKEYQGIFKREYRDSRIAPPLPFTTAYVFMSGETFYLDTFSKKAVFLNDFEEGKKYEIIFEEATNIILYVKEIE